MVIYLKHPIHGTKVACSEMEAEYDKGNGWVELDQEAKEIEVPVSDVEGDHVNNLVEKPVSRRRRKTEE